MTEFLFVFVQVAALEEAADPARAEELAAAIAENGELKAEVDRINTQLAAEQV